MPDAASSLALNPLDFQRKLGDIEASTEIRLSGALGNPRRFEQLLGMADYTVRYVKQLPRNTRAELLRFIQEVRELYPKVLEWFKQRQAIRQNLKLANRPIHQG